MDSFEPDPRSEYEWRLLESDAEHRLTVTGDARQTSVSRELVTHERPFAPRVYYVTTWTTALLALAWAALLVMFARAHRETLTRWAAALRDRLKEHLGAEVATTCSGRNVDFVKGLGGGDGR